MHLAGEKTSVPGSVGPNRFTDFSIAYFRSGWAFFIPYLSLYHLYAWFEWPANPQLPSVGKAGTAGIESPFLHQVPSLLGIFWLLHALHILLAGITAVRWWRAVATEAYGTPWKNIGRRMLPWFGLGLIFFVPGAYLEWPTDPWEHLQRITEWARHPVVSDHSAGYKSLYFLGYSVIGGNVGPANMLWVDAYLTALCLLLAWQFYRLAVATGLSPRWAFLFTILTTLATGNSCFSFSRYYALATSIIAQIGVVALTRQALLWASVPPSSFIHAASRIAAGIGLIALIAANHVQGLGMVLLNLASLAAWRICRDRKPMLWWGLAGFAFVNLAVLYGWSHHPLIDGIFRSQGWLNAWGGFNFYSWPSPVLDRTLLILGGLGMVNLLTAAALLRRNHVVGWLTWGPVLWLSLPAFALPFANMLAAKGAEQIVAFHRMFFAIPSGLALVCWLRGFIAVRLPRIHLAAGAMQAGGLLGLLAIVCSSPGTPTHNRFWNLVAITPNDLAMKQIMAQAIQLHSHSGGEVVTLPAITGVLRAVEPRHISGRDRPIGLPMNATALHLVRKVRSWQPTPAGKYMELSSDPHAQSPAAWVTMAGDSPEFVRIIDAPAGTALQNPVDRTSEILSAKAISLEPNCSYQIEVSVRQAAGSGSATLLAVAWLDETGQLLPAFTQEPSGWINGTFSYFARFTPTESSFWTTYRASFGPGELRAVPAGARAFRVGALLNTENSPAVVQLTNFRIWRKSPDAALDGVYAENIPYLVLGPDWRWLYTPFSLAAHLSHHWPKDQLASDLVGASEINATLKAYPGHFNPNRHE